MAPLVDQPDFTEWLRPPRRLDIARILFDSPGPVSALRIGELLGTHQSNASQLVKELHGLITTRKSDAVKGRRGPRPVEYFLSPAQQSLAKRALSLPGSERDALRSSTRAGKSPRAAPDPQQSSRGDDDAVAGDGRVLRRGQELVVADITGGAYGDVLQALAEMTTQARAAVWTAVIGDELIFVFERSEAASELLAVLHGARVTVRRGAVSQVGPVAELLERSKEIAPQVRRARHSRAAHEAAD